MGAEEYLVDGHSEMFFNLCEVVRFIVPDTTPPAVRETGVGAAMPFVLTITVIPNLAATNNNKSDNKHSNNLVIYNIYNK